MLFRSLGEGGGAQDDAVVVAAARHRLVVVGQDDVAVGGAGVEGEPGHCGGEREGVVAG